MPAPEPGSRGMQAGFVRGRVARAEGGRDERTARSGGSSTAT